MPPEIPYYLITDTGKNTVKKKPPFHKEGGDFS